MLSYLLLSPTVKGQRLSTPPKPTPMQTNRFIVLALTFLCYTAYHASRKPPSIVKSVLHGDSQADGGWSGGAVDKWSLKAGRAFWQAAWQLQAADVRVASRPRLPCGCQR